MNLSGVMQRLPKSATRGKQNPNLVIGKWRSSRQPQEVQYSTCPPPVNGSRQWVVGQFEDRRQLPRSGLRGTQGLHFYK